MPLKFLIDNICLTHNTGYGHPENANRIKSLLNTFPSLNKNLNIINKDVISSNELSKIISEVHNPKLIKQISESRTTHQTFFDHDTIASKNTYQAALKASSLAISSALLSTKDISFFSIMRPPGHHATTRKAMGFCFFNNVSLASQALLNNNKTVAIIDFDFHYGNGTADIFWNNPNVLYISIHADPTFNYPNQGFLDEIGDEDGKGYNICIPLSNGASEAEVLYCLEKIVFPILDDYNPSIIGFSAGFDSFKDDPVGGGFLKYSINGFNQLGNVLFSYSRERQIPNFHVLEGGYNIEFLPKLVYEYSKPWLGERNEVKSYDNGKRKRVKSKEKKTVEYLKQLLKPYWNFT